MIRFASIAPLAAMTIFSISSLAQTAPTPPASASAGSALPDEPGRATLLRVCTGCHEPTIVAQQRRTEKDWHDLVEQMAGTGAQATDAEFAEITRYLSKNFPAGN